MDERQKNFTKISVGEFILKKGKGASNFLIENTRKKKQSAAQIYEEQNLSQLQSWKTLLESSTSPASKAIPLFLNFLQD